jgi:hypothetical protein
MSIHDSVVERNRKKEEEIEYEVVTKVLCDFDYEKEKNEINKITDYFQTDRPRCKRCGSLLRLIDGKCGEFWGCSEFPRCEYTENWIVN